MIIHWLIIKGVKVKYWGGIAQYEKQIINDKIKMEYCRDNNIPLIIIKYDENISDILSNSSIF